MLLSVLSGEFEAGGRGVEFRRVRQRAFCTWRPDCGESGANKVEGGPVVVGSGKIAKLDSKPHVFVRGLRDFEERLDKECGWVGT